MMSELAGAQWFKSTYSGSDVNCVEVAFLDSGRVGIRDSKNRANPALLLSATAFDTFIAAAARGDFRSG